MLRRPGDQPVAPTNCMLRCPGPPVSHTKRSQGWSRRERRRYSAGRAPSYMPRRPGDQPVAPTNCVLRCPGPPVPHAKRSQGWSRRERRRYSAGRAPSYMLRRPGDQPVAPTEDRAPTNTEVQRKRRIVPPRADVSPFSVPPQVWVWRFRFRAAREPRS